MKGRRATGGKGLIALVCSLLMVFQPVLAAPPSSVTGAVRNSLPIHLYATPALLGTHVNAMLEALLLFARPESTNTPELIAVAKVNGTAERNGRPLLNGSIVSSGDSLSTHGDSALLLTPAPDERLWLGPNTSAKLTKDAGNVAVALEHGTLGFQTRGHIQVTLEQQDGLAIRSRPDSLALAQLSYVNEQEAQVQLQKGSLELVRGDQAVLLQPEQSRMISATGTRSAAEPPTKKYSSAQEGSAAQSGTGSIKGTVVDAKLYVVPGANVTLTNAVGNTLKTVTDREGKFVFSGVAIGIYTLSVVHAGFPNYETPDVVVTGGKETSLYVQLGGGGGGKSHKGLLIGLVVVGAGVGIGVGVAAGHHGTTSPSTPQ